MSHIAPLTRGSYVTMTTRPRATRRISRTPRSHASSQWCKVRTAMAASTAPSRSGRTSAGADRGHPRRGPLRSHDVARLDGDDVAIVRFVRSRAGAHVDDRPRVAERGDDPCTEARVLAPGPRVAKADRVVAVAGRVQFVVSSAPPYAVIAICRNASFGELDDPKLPGRAVTPTATPRTRPASAEATDRTGRS